MEIDIERIKGDTTKDGTIKIADLAFLTPGYVEADRKKATSVDEDKSQTLWQANNFYIDGDKWHWQCSPGDPCGAQISKVATFRQGMTHGVGGTCIGGFRWYNIVIP